MHGARRHPGLRLPVAALLALLLPGVPGPAAGGDAAAATPRRVVLRRLFAGPAPAVPHSSVTTCIIGRTRRASIGCPARNAAAPGSLASGPIEIPRGAVLAVGLALVPRSPRARREARGCEFVLLADGDGDGKTVELLRRRVAARLPDGGWLDVEVPLDRFAGRRVSFVFEARCPGTEGGKPSPLAPVWGDARILGPGPVVPPRNIVVVSLDTMRADILGAFGSPWPTSPNIDRIALDGTAFERISTTYPSTLVSHLSLFSGLWPSEFMAPGEDYPMRGLPAGATTLPELLAGDGWTTAAFTEDGFLVADLGFQRGFDAYTEFVGPAGDAPGAGAPSRSSRGWTDAFRNMAGGDGERTFAEARRWIRDHRRDAFFLFVHTYEVHSPYTPPPEFDIFSPPTSTPGVPHADALAAGTRNKFLYAGEVLLADTLVAELVAELAETGLLDSTILVLVADHGEGFGEHGLTGHGNSLHEELLHVPLVIRAPDLVAAGARDTTPGSIIDIAPTILALVGRPRFPGHSGQPLGARDEGAGDRAIYAELRGDAFPFEKDGPGKRRVEVAVRRGDRKWILRDDEPGRDAVFDLAADPGEAAPGTAPADLAAGRAAALSYRSAAARRRAGFGIEGGAPAAPLAVEPSVEEKLRHLGYLR